MPLASLMPCLLQTRPNFNARRLDPITHVIQPAIAVSHNRHDATYKPMPVMQEPKPTSQKANPRIVLSLLG